MTHYAMTALLGPEFDAFLFASVGKESNGGSLSVLSALAQADVDPWREAAELARMPREAANQRLTASAPATIADRLVKLLPRKNLASVASRGRVLQTDSTLRSRTMTNMILINMLVMAGLLFAQWALADLQPPHEDVAHAAVSRTVVEQTPQAGQLNR
jgi:hypothetical protein